MTKIKAILLHKNGPQFFYISISFIIQIIRLNCGSYWDSILILLKLVFWPHFRLITI